MILSEVELHKSTSYSVDKRWVYRVCTNCMSNSHEHVQMLSNQLVSGDPAGTRKKEMWVCPVCGYTRRM